MLGKLAGNECNMKWPRVINDIEYAINNSKHKSTGETPSRMLFGMDQIGKVNDEIKMFLESQIDRNLENIRTSAEKNREKPELQ